MICSPRKKCAWIIVDTGPILVMMETTDHAILPAGTDPAALAIACLDAWYPGAGPAQVFGSVVLQNYVGGTFDYLAGRIKRAPMWLRRLGFEWAYRLYREPWRWRRQVALIPFGLLSLRAAIIARSKTRLHKS